MPFVEIYLASQLSEGAISYLGYANRIYVLPEQLFTIVISTVLFPAMAADIASRNLDALKDKLSRAFNLTVFIMLPVSCLMIALSQPILSVTLRRGAFGQVDADHAASVLAAYSIALLAVCVRSLVTFGFFALQKPQVLLRWTAFMVPVNVLLDLILIPHFSYVGVALGCSITTVLHAAVLSVLLRRELKMGLIRHHGILVLKVAACCGLMLLAVLFLQHGFEGVDLGASTIRQILTLVVMVAATSSIYMLSAKALQGKRRHVGLGKSQAPHLNSRVAGILFCQITCWGITARPLKILIISTQVPYPTRDGATIRVFNLLKELSRKHDIFLATIVRGPAEKRRLEAIRPFCKEIHAASVSRSRWKRWAQIVTAPFVIEPHLVRINRFGGIAGNRLTSCESGRCHPGRISAGRTILQWFRWDQGT